MTVNVCFGWCGLLCACLPEGVTVEALANRLIHYTLMQSFISICFIFLHPKTSRWTLVTLVFTFFYWSLFPAASEIFAKSLSGSDASCQPPAFTVGLNENGDGLRISCCPIQYALAVWYSRGVLWHICPFTALSHQILYIAV